MSPERPTGGPWPNDASAAITVTFDNMGEAADINRGLWPDDQPIGSHYSVVRMLPKFLALAKRYDIHVTYFAESWNLGVYPDAIKSIAEAGHEVAWHAWQHEAWSKECKDEQDERGNFERSFEAMTPGGSIHGERTLKMCREFGLGYISPAAQEGAVVDVDGGKDSIVVLPFWWSTVDAYYYMESFGKLRVLKGVLREDAQGPDVLVEALVRQIDKTIKKGGFLSLLFHPFLNDNDERLQAMETVLQHLAKRRDESKTWLATCREVEQWVRAHPDVLGSDPIWDNSSWR